MCLATVDAAIGLVKHLLSKLTGKLEHHLDVLGLSISLMLSSLCKEDVLVSEKKDPAFKKVFGVCEVALLDWVKNHNVIGGSFFGGRIQNTTILYSLDELKVYTYYNHVIVSIRMVFSLDMAETFVHSNCRKPTNSLSMECMCCKCGEEKS